MIERERRQAVFARGKPETRWQGEPLLGSIYGEEEVDAAVSAIREAMDVSKGFGFTASPIPEFEQAFAAYVGTKHAVSMNSAGPGLDMAMRYLNLDADDEVIVPAVNFVAAPLAVAGVGARIVWGEVDPHTLQLDPNDVEEKITPRTRAIFAVHMNGLSAPMDDYLELARRHPHDAHGPLAVIGDAARACGGGYKHGKIGKAGLLNVFSFHTMKNMTTLGEGGMVTTDDDDVAAYCRSTRFYGGATDVWGTSNVMTKVQAAVGLVQLSKLDGFIAARRALAQQRTEWLEGVPELALPPDPPDRLHSYYLYTCVVCDAWAGAQRDELMRRMDEEFCVRCVVANKPVYLHRAILREHSGGLPLPVSENLGERILCVPIHPAMSQEDNEYISASLIECVEGLR
ncbi:MAG: DegT/DnrJ/EryC1/StrS family aminotransferase [Candidatus Hydrogenedentes bacterium]|nr:DegT/DnrJ/EryC1/StrS family aminotransferase [Candidatus Hydrogenedentota bacterium]